MPVRCEAAASKGARKARTLMKEERSIACRFALPRLPTALFVAWLSWPTSIVFADWVDRQMSTVCRQMASTGWGLRA